MSPNEYAKGMTSFFKKYVHISDEINLSYEDDRAIQDLWSDGKTSKVGELYNVPCDLIISKTIPLPNIRIVVDERGHDDGGVVRYEVLILPDRLMELQKARGCYESPGYMQVGIIKFLSRAEIIIPFYVTDGGNYFATAPGIIIDGEIRQADVSFCSSCGSLLSTWYGIQIALLHPETRRCFRGLSINEDTQQKSNEEKDRKRQAHYVRKVYVKRGELARRISKGRARHTLSWYVIGHWRHYKNGKKVFINGYWKGILKDAKRNLDDGRIRVVSA